MEYIESPSNATITHKVIDRRGNVTAFIWKDYHNWHGICNDSWDIEQLFFNRQHVYEAHYIDGVLRLDSDNHVETIFPEDMIRVLNDRDIVLNEVYLDIKRVIRSSNSQKFNYKLYSIKSGVQLIIECNRFKKSVITVNIGNNNKVSRIDITKISSDRTETYSENHYNANLMEKLIRSEQYYWG